MIASQRVKELLPSAAAMPSRLLKANKDLSYELHLRWLNSQDSLKILSLHHKHSSLHNCIALFSVFQKEFQSSPNIEIMFPI